MDPTEILGTKQASEITQLPEGTLRYYRHTNQGPESFVLGRRVMYRRSAIEQWIAEMEEATRRGGTQAAAAG